MKTSKETQAEIKDQAACMAEMAEALRQNWEQALRTSLKFQEEAGRWWSSVVNPADCAQQWQQQLNAATRTANSMLPLAQKQMGELVDLAEKNSKTSVELVKKALNATQAVALADSQDKWADFWTSSFDAARTNSEKLSQINARAIDNWSEFIRNKVGATDARNA